MPVIAPIISWAATVLADPNSMPIEKHEIGVTAETGMQTPTPLRRGILSPGLSTIGLDLEMSRLDDDTGLFRPTPWETSALTTSSN